MPTPRPPGPNTGPPGWLTDALEGLGYAVTRGACQLPTAFTASIGTGDLRIGICAEYDALPGLGHACGHNIIAAAAIGAATGLAGVADQLGLTVTVLGTPAEEGGGGKIFMLDRGAFDGLHAAMMIHPGPGDVGRAEPFAVDHQHISYRGTTAHAAAYPELGVNAADAFTIAQVAIGLLRQQLPASVRVHGIVTRPASHLTPSPTALRAAGTFAPPHWPSSTGSNHASAPVSKPARWPPAVSWRSSRIARVTRSSATTSSCSACSWPMLAISAAHLLAPASARG